MRNDELFSPHCPDPIAKRLVLTYAFRGMLDDRKTYYPHDLLARQHAVYEKWLLEARKYHTSFSCGFYEWTCRDSDTALVFKPGDLVKYKGQYCVVTRWNPDGVSWSKRWRICAGITTQESWPDQMDRIELKDPSGHTYTVNALSKDLESADIPPEIFALACRKAKDCPMMKGGGE